MDYVYMLRCSDDSYYTGWTNRLHHRLHAHASGRGAKYTKARRPVRLVHVETCEDKRTALRREYEIKQLTRVQKEQLIQEGSDRGMTKGKIFYLMGKSAVGKDHIYEQLLAMPELKLTPLVIYTTRPMRDGEEDGVTYHFTDEAGLGRMRKSGKVIEERCYHVTAGLWWYFTADDDSFAGKNNLLGIGTPESFRKLRAYFGADRVVPLYIEVSDQVRIHRALQREDKQEHPQYEEMCRRFLSDSEDFAPEKLAEAGIEQGFANDGKLSDCLEQLADYILMQSV